MGPGTDTILEDVQRDTDDLPEVAPRRLVQLYERAAAPERAALAWELARRGLHY